MIYTPKTKLAMKLAYKYHENEKDLSGMPYIYHPIIVASSMDDEDSTCTALMHDLIEDTNLTIDDIKGYGFNSDIIDALTLLTKTKGEDYFEYIKRISENKLATKVKIADLKHNMDLNRLDKVTKKDLDRQAKYKKCLEYLEKTKASLD